MVVSELVTAMRRKLFFDRARYDCMRGIAIHILRHDVFRVVFSNMLSLLVPQPACLHKLDPAIVTEDC